MTLTSRQKSHLKALAHPLEPLVRIGRPGRTDGVAAEAERTLKAHELIKVRIDADDPASRREIATKLSEELHAELVQTVGKIAVLFRANGEKSKFKLPD